MSNNEMLKMAVERTAYMPASKQLEILKTVFDLKESEIVKAIKENSQRILNSSTIIESNKQWHRH